MTLSIRVSSALFLILTFLVLPFGGISPVSISPSIAHATTDGGPTTGYITGVVHIGAVDTPTSLPHPGATVNIKLVENSDTVIATALTDASGSYNIEVPFGAYVVCLQPASGFRLANGVSECQSEISLNSENSPLSLSTFMVVELPALHLLGDNPYILVKGSNFSLLDPGAEVLNLGNCSEGPSELIIYTSDVVDSEATGDTTVTYHLPNNISCGPGTVDITRIVRVFPPTPVGNVIGSRVGAGEYAPPEPQGQNLAGTSTASTTVTVGEVAGASTECHFINAYMRRSYDNDKLEVLKLQAFLIFTEGNTSVKPTGVFDEATELAVRTFQNKYAKDVLEPWGRSENTGIVGMLTQKKINDIYCGFVSAFTSDQKIALEDARNSLHAELAVLPEKTEELVGSESMTSKMSRWWDKAKENLVAAFPFGKDKKGEASSVSKNGNLAAADSSEEKQQYSWITVLISLLFGSAVVLIAGYLFKRTRVVVLKAK